MAYGERYVGIVEPRLTATFRVGPNPGLATSPCAPSREHYLSGRNEGQTRQSGEPSAIENPVNPASSLIRPDVPMVAAVTGFHSIRYDLVERRAPQFPKGVPAKDGGGEEEEGRGVLV